MKLIAFVLVGMLGAILLALPGALIVMVLWNVVLPDLFDAPTITFFQSWALVIMCNVLTSKPEVSVSK